MPQQSINSNIYPPTINLWRKWYFFNIFNDHLNFSFFYLFVLLLTPIFFFLPPPPKIDLRTCLYFLVNGLCLYVIYVRIYQCLILAQDCSYCYNYSFDWWPHESGSMFDQCGVSKTLFMSLNHGYLYMFTMSNKPVLCLCLCLNKPEPIIPLAIWDIDYYTGCTGTH